MSSTRNVYVGLFFLVTSYPHGIDSTIAYFNSVEPQNTVVIEKYIVDGTPELTKQCLQNFLTKYPSGDRATISERTSIISVLATEIQSLQLNIPCFSITATANIIKTLPNSLTYAPYDQYSVMNNFMIYVEYQMKHMTVLYEPNTLDDTFYKGYIELLQKQGGLLNIPIEIDTLVMDKKYQFERNTAIILLFNDTALIDKNFLSQIPKGCYVSMTDANYNISDIFGNVPAFVIIPFPIDYTSTSQNVYNNLIDKTNYIYNIYGFFDILYTINFFTTTFIPFTLQTYVDVNPFDKIPSAFGYASWNLSINGSDYGLYDIIFTKNSIIGNEDALFNKYNNGGTARLPQSQSIFVSMGIGPFFSSKIFLCRQNYIKIYNQCKRLIVVRFEKNTTIYKNNQIIISETLPCNFNISYTQDGYFSYLQPIFSVCDARLRVNLTMSKKTLYEILFEDGQYDPKVIKQLRNEVCNIDKCS